MQATYPPRPTLAELWGEADPGREWREAEAKGRRAVNRLCARRQRLEDRYDAPFRAAEEKARRAFWAAQIERERADHAADMRDYRARKRAMREAIIERPRASLSVPGVSGKVIGDDGPGSHR